MLRLTLVLLLLVVPASSQEPQPRDPHTVQGCSNGYHPDAEVHDCACQNPTQRMDACDKRPETRTCATYCRQQHCHCSPICGDRQDPVGN
jgi:hypothetical protein